MQTPAYAYFTWQPPAHGHHWVEARPVANDWSVRKETVPVLTTAGNPMFWQHYGKAGTEYRPLETESGLFRELAAIEPEPDAIRAFADRYGPLTPGRLFVPPGVHHKFPRPPRPKSYSERLIRPHNAGDPETQLLLAEWFLLRAVIGESFELWKSTIHELQTLVSLWDALVRRERKRIEQFAHLGSEGKKRTVTLVHASGEILQEPVRWDEPSSARLTLAAGAEHALLLALNRRVSAKAYVSLLPLSMPPHRKLLICPETLRDALWLQFALAVLERKSFRACEVCGKPFEISPQVARTNRLLCSAACKARAHRQRRELALKLAGDGLSVEQIAERVGSQPATVAGWMDSIREK
jgi:hypothetical protein